MLRPSAAPTLPTVAPGPPPRHHGQPGRRSSIPGERRSRSVPRGRRKTADERPKPPKGSGNGSSANLGFESHLWAAADKLRANMDAAEYKHVVLGLIFLKYISDAFEEH